MFRLSLRLAFAAVHVTSLPTPNPDCMQFRCSVEDFLPSDVTCDVHNFKLKNLHPIASGLFEQYETEIRSVFIAQKYVAVMKQPRPSWDALDRSIANFLGCWLMQNDPVNPSAEGISYDDDTEIKPTDSEVVACIKELIKEKVRPMVQQDGGDVKFVSFTVETGIVLLAMLGACQSCPSSQNTLKDGIERMMHHWIPEVKLVEETKDRSLWEKEENALFKDKDDVFRVYNDFEKVRQEELAKLRKRAHPTRKRFEELTEPCDDD